MHTRPFSNLIHIIHYLLPSYLFLLFTLALYASIRFSLPFPKPPFTVCSLVFPFIQSLHIVPFLFLLFFSLSPSPCPSSPCFLSRFSVYSVSILPRLPFSFCFYIFLFYSLPVPPASVTSPFSALFSLYISSCVPFLCIYSSLSFVLSI